MPPSNSPALSPRFRLLRALLFALVCLATLVALFYAEENLRGKHAWNAYAREQIAKGEKLSLTDFNPPTIPDDQNLTLCPLLKPIFDIEFRTVTEGKIKRVSAVNLWRDTNGLNRLQHWDRTWSVVQYHATHPATNRAGEKLHQQFQELKNRLEKSPLTNGWIDLAGWQAFYRTGTNLDGVAATNSPAVDVLCALRFVDGDIAELKREATRHHLARWPIYYDTNAPWGILLPHLGRCKQLIALLQLRSAAHLAVGDAESGFAEIELALRMAESVREEPFLISQLVRNVSLDLLLQPVKEGLARHQFTDAQLARLQKELGAVDLLAAHQQSMRAERALNCEWNRYAKEGSSIDWRSLFGNNELGDTFSLLSTCARFAPSGWVYQNQLTLCRFHDRFALTTIDAQARRAYPEVLAAASADSKLRSRFNPFNLLARLLFPATGSGSAARKCTHTQTELNEAVLACALERHRLSHASFPESLQALIPRFLENIPQDLFSGHPLQYRRTDEAQYLVSSAGWSEKAPGGEEQRPWFGTLGIGDWNWQLPGKP